MRLSTHARQRWQERCAHLELDEELATLRRASKATLNRLRRGWERSNGVGTWPASHDYFVSQNGVIFIEAGGQAITVLLVRDVKRWDVRRSIDDRLRRKHAII